MRLKVDNLVAYVTDYTSREHKWLEELLTYNLSSSYFSGAPPIQMVSFYPSRFPTGFVRIVIHSAKEAEISLELEDIRKKPCEVDRTPDTSWLRWYQKEAIEAIIRRSRGVIKAPTGSGKTRCAIALAMHLPCKWLFLTHRTMLMDQAAEAFEQVAKEEAGRIGDGVFKPRRFTVATFQTLSKAIQRGDEDAISVVAGAGGLFVDEAHVLPSDSFRKVTELAENAYYRVGLSATPFDRDDERSIYTIGILGPIVYEVAYKTLIDEGVLARPNIHMVEIVQRCERPTWAGAYGEGVVRSKIRNDAIVECAVKTEKPALVFVKGIEHGRALTKMLGKRGLRAGFAWGDTSSHARGSAVKSLVRGDLDVLVASVIMQEGIDIPELRSVVVASGGKSIISALQRIGRGMRRSEGKYEFQVYDIMDRGCGCKDVRDLATGGYLVTKHTGCDWLERHARRRRRAYQREGMTVKLEQLGALPQFAIPFPK